MLGLAAIRYRNVHSSRGGPVTRIAESPLALPGEALHHANVWLDPRLGLIMHGGNLFSDASGSGTHRLRMTARHMAVSEALERWAYLVTSRELKCGFREDPTSNGMAAFPGLTATEARVRAKAEALERHSLLSWWEEGTACQVRPTPWPDIQAVELVAVQSISVVIVFGPAGKGRYAYGFGAGRTFTDACRRAGIEMVRHALVVARRCEQLAQGTASKLTGLFERRAWFFSSSEGHAEFRRVVDASNRGGAPRAPECCFDGPIHGPWSRYAQVWRVAYRPPSRRYLTEGERYFFW